MRTLLPLTCINIWWSSKQGTAIPPVHGTCLHWCVNWISWNETLMIPAEKQMIISEVHMIQGLSEGWKRSKTCTKTFCGSHVPYLTDMENSPGALSLSLTRKAPHSRCLSRLSATLRDIRPANHLEKEEGGRMRPDEKLHQFLHNTRGVCQCQISIRRRQEVKNKDRAKIEKQN